MNHGRMRAIIAALAMTSTLGVTASAEASGGCDTFSYTERNHAVATVYGGSCYVRVRHYYEPVWSMHNYWTNWAGGSVAGKLYKSTDSAVLLKYQVEA